MEVLEASALPCLFPVHPRTGLALERLGYRSNGQVHLVTPVGYLESLALVRHAAAVVTDSGGLQREAYWLGIPCLTVRAETEWTATAQVGANRLIESEQAARLPATITEALAWGEPCRSWDGWDHGSYSSCRRMTAAAEAPLAGC